MGYVIKVSTIPENKLRLVYNHIGKLKSFTIVNTTQKLKMVLAGRVVTWHTWHLGVSPACMNQVWWHIPVTPALTQKVKAEGFRGHPQLHRV